MLMFLKFMVMRRKASNWFVSVEAERVPRLKAADTHQLHSLHRGTLLDVLGTFSLIHTTISSG